MAIKPSPDRSDLESKSRDDLQTIAKVKGVDLGARATKAALIDAIMDSGADPSPAGDAPTSRSVRSRRTVATPEDDFELLLGEFTSDIAPASAGADAPATPTASTAPSTTPSTAIAEQSPTAQAELPPSARTTRPERQ